MINRKTKVNLVKYIRKYKKCIEIFKKSEQNHLENRLYSRRLKGVEMMHCKKIIILMLGICISVFSLFVSIDFAPSNPPFIILAVFSFSSLTFCFIQFILCEQLQQTYKSFYTQASRKINKQKK
jgi:hypothetical protein